MEFLVSSKHLWRWKGAVCPRQLASRPSIQRSSLRSGKSRLLPKRQNFRSLQPRLIRELLPDELASIPLVMGELIASKYFQSISACLDIDFDTCLISAIIDSPPGLPSPNPRRNIRNLIDCTVQVPDPVVSKFDRRIEQSGSKSCCYGSQPDQRSRSCSHSGYATFKIFKARLCHSRTK